MSTDWHNLLGINQNRYTYDQRIKAFILLISMICHPCCQAQNTKCSFYGILLGLNLGHFCTVIIKYEKEKCISKKKKQSRPRKLSYLTSTLKDLPNL